MLVGRLKVGAASLKEKGQQLLVALQQQQQENRDLQAKLDAQGELGSESTEAARQELAAVQAELLTVQAEVSQLRQSQTAELRMLQEQSENFRQQAAAEKTALEAQLEQTRAELQSEIDAAKEMEHALLDESALLQQENHQIQGRLASLQLEHSALAAQLQQKAAQSDQLTEECARRLRAIELLQARFKQADQELRDKLLAGDVVPTKLSASDDDEDSEE